MKENILRKNANFAGRSRIVHFVHCLSRKSQPVAYSISQRGNLEEEELGHSFASPLPRHDRQRMNKRIAFCSLVLCFALLVVGTCTSVFTHALKRLPKNSDLAFHFLAHTVIVCLLAVVSRLPLMIIFFSSSLFAVLVEFAQQLLVVGRSGQGADIFAAFLGSLATFLFSEEHIRGRRPLRPAIAKVLGVADDEGDEGVSTSAVQGAEDMV